MKKTKRIIAALLCICALAMTACDGDKPSEETSAPTQESSDTQNNGTTESENSGGSVNSMKDVKINGKTLDQLMVVTDFTYNEAGKTLASTIKKEMGAKVILHCGEEDIPLYPTMSYIQIATLPINGVSERLGDTQARFYEENGNFKMLLGSRKITESAAVEYFLDTVINETKELKGYNKTVELPTDATLASAIDKADAASAAILNAPNKYSAKDVTGNGKCYYVSYSAGSDSNDGLSPEKPWKTIDKVSKASLPAGSVVLFKRGDIWRFDSYASASKPGYLILQSNVIYSSYGEGAKPAIYGSPRNAAEVGTWTQTGVKNVWKYSEKYAGMPNSTQDDVGCIVFNEGEAYGYKMIKGQSEITFNGKLEELDQNFKFWYNPEDNHVYLYYDGGNPGEKFDSIEMGVRLNMVRASGGKTNIIFDNFTIKYGGAHGITVATSDKITVTNCEVGWMGGGVYDYSAKSPARYGNGVEINRDSRDIVIDNNYFYQIYDAGVTHQYDSRNNPESTTTCYHENIDYTNNVFEYCFYGVEYFIGTAKIENISRYMKNITISGNYIMYSGYGWGTWRKPSGVPGSAAIKAWNAEASTIVGGTITVEKNTIALCKYDVIYSTVEEEEDMSKYLNNTLIQYAGQKGPTIAVSSESIPVGERPLWDEKVLADHKYLSGKGNTYYTVK